MAGWQTSGAQPKTSVHARATRLISALQREVAREQVDFPLIFVGPEDLYMAGKAAFEKLVQPSGGWMKAALGPLYPGYLINSPSSKIDHSHLSKLLSFPSMLLRNFVQRTAHCVGPRRWTSTAAASGQFFHLSYDYVEGILEKRAPHRAGHLAHAQAHIDRGEVLMGGAFADAR